jgi:anti-anti-sigma factor
MTPVTFVVERSSEESRLRVRGDIDITNAGRLHAEVSSLLDPPPPRIILDFTDVPFCDTTGLNTLVRLQEQSEAAGTHIAVYNPQPIVARVFDLVGITEHLRVHSSPTGHAGRGTNG